MDKRMEELRYRMNFIIENIPSDTDINNYHGHIHKYAFPVFTGNAEIFVRLSYELFPYERPIFDNIISLVELSFDYIAKTKIRKFISYIDIVLKRLDDYELDKYDEKKIFKSAKERIFDAARAFREENYPSCISNVHTAIEISLKDKLKIPPVINNIKVGPLIGFCIRNNVFPNLKLYLKQIDQRANVVDNDYKHQSYVPTRPEALQALNLGEKFIAEIENANPILPQNFLDEIEKDIKFLNK